MDSRSQSSKYHKLPDYFKDFCSFIDKLHIQSVTLEPMISSYDPFFIKG